MRLKPVQLLLIALPRFLTAQGGPSQASAATFREAGHRFSVAHETSILREFSDFLAIPNLASDGPNIRRNATRLIEMLAPMLGEIDELHDQAEVVASLRDLLLPKLVTGQIDVSKLDLAALVDDQVA